MSVALVDDLDGGGFADLVIGAPEWTDDPSNPEKGRVFIFFGENWHNATGPQPARGADVRFDGGHAHRRFGFSVAGAGDVDGDGYGDLLIGSPGCHSLDKDTTCPSSVDSFEGQALLVHGGPNGLREVDAWVGSSPPVGPVLGASGLPLGSGQTPGISICEACMQTSLVLTGLQGGDRFGFSVAGLGDLDNDGKAEYAVGAIQGYRSRNIGYEAHPNDPTQGGNDYRGYVQVFSLNSNTPIAEIRPVTDPAEHWPTLFGFSISTIGDIDGDFVQDMIVGAPGTYEVRSGIPGTARGAVFAYSGEPLIQSLVFERANSLNFFDPTPAGDYEVDESAQFGYSISGAMGTIDDDTTPFAPDLIAGAWNHGNVNGLILILTPDSTTGQMTIVQRIGVPPGSNNHERFGSASTLGHVYSTTATAVIGGAHGQAVSGSNAEEGHVHAFDYDSVFP